MELFADLYVYTFIIMMFSGAFLGISIWLIEFWHVVIRHSSKKNVTFDDLDKEETIRFFDSGQNPEEFLSDINSQFRFKIVINDRFIIRRHTITDLAMMLFYSGLLLLFLYELYFWIIDKFF